jgi:hypothetical protein
MTIWWSKDLHDARKLLLFILTWEDRVASPKFSENASERPHINTQAITATKYDFRAPVKSRLDVSIHLLFLTTTAAKINDSDIGFACLAE